MIVFEFWISCDIIKIGSDIYVYILIDSFPNLGFIECLPNLDCFYTFQLAILSYKHKLLSKESLSQTQLLGKPN